MSVSTTIRLSNDLRKKIEKYAQLEHRTISEQIQAWLSLAYTVKMNPDLPYNFIKDTLEAKVEDELGLAENFESYPKV